MGEHNFTNAQTKNGQKENTVTVNDRHLQVHLPPNTHIDLEIGMERFANPSSYEQSR